MVVSKACTHLVRVGRATAVELATVCGCTVRELTRAIGDHPDFRRVAGQGVWDYRLERSTAVRLSGRVAEADRSVRAAAALLPRPPRVVESAPAHPCIPGLIKWREGWQGRDGEPTIVVALRFLGPSSLSRLAEFIGCRDASIRRQARRYCGDHLVVLPGRPVRYALRELVR